MLTIALLTTVTTLRGGKAETTSPTTSPTDVAETTAVAGRLASLELSRSSRRRRSRSRSRSRRRRSRSRSRGRRSNDGRRRGIPLAFGGEGQPCAAPTANGCNPGLYCQTTGHETFTTGNCQWKQNPSPGPIIGGDTMTPKLGEYGQPCFDGGKCNYGLYCQTTGYETFQTGFCDYRQDHIGAGSVGGGYGQYRRLDAPSNEIPVYLPSNDGRRRGIPPAFGGEGQPCAANTANGCNPGFYCQTTGHETFTTGNCQRSQNPGPIIGGDTMTPKLGEHGQPCFDGGACNYGLYCQTTGYETFQTGFCEYRQDHMGSGSPSGSGSPKASKPKVARSKEDAASRATTADSAASAVEDPVTAINHV